MIVFNEIALRLLTDNHYLYLEMKKYSKQFKIENDYDNDKILLEVSYYFINNYFNKNNLCNKRKKELSNDFLARFFEYSEKINEE
jgi:hypothetical protein